MFDLQIEDTCELSDQYAVLKCHVERQLPIGPGSCVTVGVTSCRRGEGVSSVVLNLALAFSQNPETRVLVVDAKPNNIARTRMMKRLWKNRSAPREPAESTAIERTGRGDSKLIRTEGNFDIILVQGRPSRARGYFKVEPFRMFLEKAREQYNLILVDAPSIRESSFTPMIASSLEGLLLVIEAGGVRREVLKRAVEDVRKMGGQIMGVVLNKQRYPIPEFIYRWI